jgi:hypothetical protein
MRLATGSYVQPGREKQQPSVGATMHKAQGRIKGTPALYVAPLDDVLEHSAPHF